MEMTIKEAQERLAAGTLPLGRVEIWYGSTVTNPLGIGEWLGPTYLGRPALLSTSTLLKVPLQVVEPNRATKASSMITGTPRTPDAQIVRYRYDVGKLDEFPTEAEIRIIRRLNGGGPVAEAIAMAKKAASVPASVPAGEVQGGASM